MRGRKIVKVNALSFAQLVKFMREGVHSCEELADLTGLHYLTVLQYSRELHLAGEAHISSWVKDSRGRDAIKVYQLGPGADAPRHRKTAVERSAAYRKRKAQERVNAVLGGRGGFTAQSNGRVRYDVLTPTPKQACDGSNSIFMAP